MGNKTFGFLAVVAVVAALAVEYATAQEGVLVPFFFLAFFCFLSSQIFLTPSCDHIRVLHTLLCRPGVSPVCALLSAGHQHLLH